jgi:hypothetical protein
LGNHTTNPAELFGRIYRDKVWGGDGVDFFSGTGSHTPELIEPYVSAVRGFVSQLSPAPVLVDLGCGDFVAGSRLADLGRSYIGCDVVPELIDRNRRLFVRENLRFIILDAVLDPLPPGDVVIVKQVLQHLCNQQIAAIVSKLAQYKIWIVCEHLPAGTFTANRDNVTCADTRLPLKSGIVLTEAPFHVKPRETRVLCEVASEGGVIRTVAYVF